MGEGWGTHGRPWDIERGRRRYRRWIFNASAFSIIFDSGCFLKNWNEKWLNIFFFFSRYMNLFELEKAAPPIHLYLFFFFWHFKAPSRDETILIVQQTRLSIRTIITIFNSREYKREGITTLLLLKIPHSLFHSPYFMTKKKNIYIYIYAYKIS